MPTDSEPAATRAGGDDGDGHDGTDGEGHGDGGEGHGEDDELTGDDDEVTGEDDGVHREVVHARGHEHVSATHASTLEVTSDDWLTPAGDCIIAVDADRTPADFDPAFRDAARDRDATITCTLTIDPPMAELGSAEFGSAAEATAEPAEGDAAEDPPVASATITGRGHPDLELTNDRSMVARTSTYVDDRTIVVDADAAAADVDRDFVRALAGGADVRVVLEVES